jgi:hypothetical protein
MPSSNWTLNGGQDRVPVLDTEVPSVAVPTSMAVVASTQESRSRTSPQQPPLDDELDEEDERLPDDEELDDEEEAQGSPSKRQKVPSHTSGIVVPFQQEHAPSSPHRWA